MPRILTVDDSRAVRSIVRKQVSEMGFLGVEVAEAEDGQQGLVRLGEMSVDLVLLDVTMPVLDGPGMLAKLRESGYKMPVIMLTSESKTSIISNAMKLGISDYILKPFKAEELRAKIVAALGAKLQMGAAPVAAAPDPTAGIVAPSVLPTAPVAIPVSHAPTSLNVDVMLIDDLENVHRKLRERLPATLVMEGHLDAQAATAACRGKTIKVILIDNELPGVEMKVLTRQLRLLQPGAKLLALALPSTTTDLAKTSKDQGFDDILFKPFGQDAVDDFLIKFFDSQEILACTENLFTVGPFRGKEDRLPTYFERLTTGFKDSLKKAVAACYDDIILDMTNIPMRQERLPRMLLEFTASTKEQGIVMKLVGNADLKKLLSAFSETRTLLIHGTVQDARVARG